MKKRLFIFILCFLMLYCVFANAVYAVDLADNALNLNLTDGCDIQIPIDITEIQDSLNFTHTYTVTYDLGYAGLTDVAGDAPVDDNKYKFGDEVTVKEYPKEYTPEGYMFIGWGKIGVTLPDLYKENNKFNIYSCIKLIACYIKICETPDIPKIHTVAYNWSGDIPVDAVLPDSAEYAEGEEYMVDAAYDSSSVIETDKGKYTFSGWMLDNEVVTGTRIMGENDVIFEGIWTYSAKPEIIEPIASVYKVEHYLEGSDGEYILEDTEFPLYGKIGETVTAVSKEYEGYYVNNELSVLSGDVFKVYADDTDNIVCLVLKVYYDLKTYTVEYKWSGDVPSDAVLPVDKGEYAEGTLYTVDDTYSVIKTDKGEYTFSGWMLNDKVISGEQTMGKENVVLTGFWKYTENAEIIEPKFSVYKVEHYIETKDGKYILEDTEFPLYGKIGDTVTAVPKEYEEYELNSKLSELEGKIVEAAPGENGEVCCLLLRLYYNIIPKTYSVTYIVDNTVYDVEKYREGDTVTVKSRLRDKQFYSFEGWFYPDNIKVISGKFVMPNEDVVIKGRYTYNGFYIPVPPESEKKGTIVIRKELEVPYGYDGDTTFLFEIYKDTVNGREFYSLVKVDADDSVEIDVVAGTYYIYEVDADEYGYVLTSKCTAKDNRVYIEKGTTKKITFTNKYEKTNERVCLETEAHDAYIIGYPDGTVRPNNNITRAEIATIFFRMLTDESREYYWSQDNNFVDVCADDWFNNAVSTLTNAGIISGYTDNTFKPNEYITRAELVKIAVAFYGSDISADSDFDDTEGHWAELVIDSAYNYGFINGYEDGTFRPNQPVTRAEAMKIINRALGRNPVVKNLHKNMIIWSDNADKSTWYYADVQEATNSHKYTMKNDCELWSDIMPVRNWAALEK